MRVLIVSPYVTGRGEHFTRGGVRIVSSLVGLLRERGCSVDLATPRSAHEHTEARHDACFYQGDIHNEGMFDMLGSERSYVWRHGDESLHALSPTQLAHRPKTALLLPSETTANHVEWHVPKRVLYSALEAPKYARVSDLPPFPGHDGFVLHAQAFDPQKDTTNALAVARAAPGVRFVFRASNTHNFKRWHADPSIPKNVTVLPPEHDQEVLWKGVSAVLVTSLFETFSMMTYEALSRGLPVVADARLRVIYEWAPTVLGSASIEGLARACEKAVHPGHYRGDHWLALAHGVHARAKLQLQSLLEW